MGSRRGGLEGGKEAEDDAHQGADGHRQHDDVEGKEAGEPETAGQVAGAADSGRDSQQATHEGQDRLAASFWAMRVDGGRRPMAMRMARSNPSRTRSTRRRVVSVRSAA
jgi:hypothetical protein